MRTFFRDEAVKYAARRLEGAVIVDTPRDLRVATSLLVLVGIGMAAALVLLPISSRVPLVATASVSDGEAIAGGARVVTVHVAGRAAHDPPVGSALILTDRDGTDATGRVQRAMPARSARPAATAGRGDIRLALDPAPPARWCAIRPCRVTVSAAGPVTSVAAMMAGSLALRTGS